VDASRGEPASKPCLAPKGVVLASILHDRDAADRLGEKVPQQLAGKRDISPRRHHFPELPDALD
jgi:hypothetical protein